MDINSIFVKYSVFPGTLTVDEYFVIESEWDRLIALLSDPFNVIPETGFPLTVEDILGHLLPNEIPITYFKLPEGKEILEYKWGGVYEIAEDMYISEWSGTRYKVEYAGDSLYAFGNRRLTYRTTHIYDKDYAETWKGEHEVTEVRFTPEVNSWQFNEAQDSNIQAYVKTIFTADHGDCSGGDSNISIDIIATPFHQACNGSDAVNWGDYELLLDVYHYACNTTIKNPGDVLCNAEDMEIGLTYFSGFNSYSSWSGYDTGSGTEGKRYNGLAFIDPLPIGGLPPILVATHAILVGGYLNIGRMLDLGIKLEDDED